MIKKHKVKRTASRDFIVKYIVSRSENDKPLAPCEYHIRWVSATGEWKETRYSFADGKISTWGASGDGLYLISGNSKQYFGEYHLESAKTVLRSEEALKASAALIKTEPLAGLTTYVLKDSNPALDIETSYSPETGVIQLKRVIRAKDGSINKLIEVKEAVNIEFRDLTEDEAKIPDLPMQFDVAEQKTKDLRAAGLQGRADALQQAKKKLQMAQR